MTRLFVNRLTTMDFSYLHAERGLLGESWLIDVELGGGLDDQGMVLDFAAVKRQVKQHADETYDHKLIVPRAYAGCRIEEGDNESLVDYVTRSGEHIIHRSPPGALCLLDSDEVTPESVAAAMTASLRRSLPDNVIEVRIRLYPESTQDACFHYSHGLKHHGGNCQRIAHGHRSRLLILRDGERDPALEKEWAEHWRDIYIAAREDLASEDNMDGVLYHNYAYLAGQGGFELTIPAGRCYLIDSDTTIENLARHLAGVLKARDPGHDFEVHVFEGVDKGAVEIA